MTVGPVCSLTRSIASVHAALRPAIDRLPSDRPDSNTLAYGRWTDSTAGR